MLPDVAMIKAIVSSVPMMTTHHLKQQHQTSFQSEIKGAALSHDVAA
jgi:hypothetical protein